METNLILSNNASLTTKLYMTFSLSERFYAFPAEQIIEIVQLPDLTVLEKMPEHIVGMLNLRGKIISVVDLRKFLGLPQTPFTSEDQVLIIQSENKTIGIITDTVNDVIQFNTKFLEDVPYQSQDKYISGIYKNNDNIVALLDLKAIISDINTISSEKFDSVLTETGNLFPVDNISLAKLKKRAINLQKELKTSSDTKNYQENHFVSFSLNNEIYCISLKFVKEFCKLKSFAITPIPCVPEFVPGLINHRGNFTTIIDVKSFLQIPKSDITDKTKIIVVKSSTFQVGLLVDDVYDIVNIPADKLTHNSPAKYEKNKFTVAEVILEDNTVMNILDLDKLLSDERLYIEDAI
jgi:chemotaxis signal transduction protein